MRIPNKLKMFGNTWTIITNKDKVGGSFNWKFRKIYIGLSGNQDADVFFHEVLEAILVHNYYRFYGHEGSMEYIFHFDHSGLSRIAKQLAQILKDNNLLR